MARWSPSMRRVWIEMPVSAMVDVCGASPSMRRVWIEILGMSSVPDAFFVTLHAEGVD